MLDVHFESGALESYKDFIDAIRGAKRGSLDAIKEISGSAQWDGKITEPSGRTTFSGHVRGEHVRYNGTDSGLPRRRPYLFARRSSHIARGKLRFGAMDTEIEGTLDLTDWSFLPQNEWTADVNFDKASVETIQKFFGWNYPVQGVLSGQLHGHGTRVAPGVTGLFDLARGNSLWRVLQSIARPAESFRRTKCASQTRSCVCSHRERRAAEARAS